MSDETADILIFPPLASVIAPVCAIALEWLLPLHLVPAPFTLWSVLLGVGLMLLALSLALSGTKAFGQAKTNVDPRQPALVLVESGPYRFTRNPMYLGMIILQLGLALTFSLDWALPGALVLWAVLHFGVVLHEEAYLTGRFGTPYTDFMKRTRRWL